MGERFHLKVVLLLSVSVAFLFLAGRVYRDKVSGNVAILTAPDVSAVSVADAGMIDKNTGDFVEPSVEQVCSVEDAGNGLPGNGPASNAQVSRSAAQNPPSDSQNFSSQTGPQRGSSADAVSQQGRRRSAAVGLPGTGTRVAAVRSERYWGAVVGGGDVAGGVSVSVEDSSSSQTAADFSDDQSSVDSGNGSDAEDDSGDSNQSGIDQEDPELIVAPLDIVQIAREWEDGVLQVSYAVIVDEDDATVTPTGLIVSQQVPEGWELVEADPSVEAVDADSRVVKWLFIGDSVQNGAIYSLAMNAPEGLDGDWNETQAWYTYRQPDGQCVDVAVIPYSESDIQPAN